MAEQLFFELPSLTALGPGDYFVSEANASAHAMICDDAVWPDGKLIVLGAKGSGKSHLARLWQTRTGAAIWSPATSTRTPPCLHRAALWPSRIWTTSRPSHRNTSFTCTTT